MKYLAVGDSADGVTRLSDYAHPSIPLRGFDITLCGQEARFVSGATRQHFRLFILEVCRVNGVRETQDGLLMPDFDRPPENATAAEREAAIHRVRFGLRGRRAWKIYETTWGVLWPKIADQFNIDLRPFLARSALGVATEL